MDPVEALREIAFWRERERAATHRVQAYRRAADVVEALDESERARHQRVRSWTRLDGIGHKTATVIAQAYDGGVPASLAEVRESAVEIPGANSAMRAALRGDLHLHSDWSDGGSPPEEMLRTAAWLGHEYCVLSDHSPRLTVANGLSAERLRAQLALLDELRPRLAPLQVLTAIEVDICEDGALDQEDDLLAELDVVVASVHSKLRSDSATMTRRMIAAISNPLVDVLGHCTGRLVEGGRGTRPESAFDADAVFGACRDHDTAVEINSRPERRDPPRRLIELALQTGCLFSIDTDAHAPGQLDFLGYGSERAEAAGVPADRVVNTWPVHDLLAWTAGTCG